MEKSKIRQAYNSAFDGVESTSYSNLVSAVDYCLREVQLPLAKEIAACSDPASRTFDYGVGVTLIRIRKYFKYMFDKLGIGEFKGLLNQMVDVSVHQEHFDFVIDKKTKFSQGIMNALTVGIPFFELSQQSVIRNLHISGESNQKPGMSGACNVHMAMAIGSTQLAKLVHRVASLYDHTVDEVVPSYVDLILMYAAYFIGSVCLPAFHVAMPSRVTSTILDDVKKMSELFRRVRFSHLNDLYKNGSDKL